MHVGNNWYVNHSPWNNPCKLASVRDPCIWSESL